MSLKERLKKYLEYKKISQADFAYSIDASSGYVNAIRKSISPEKTILIKEKYPDLNIDWLIYDQGQMLNAPRQTQSTSEVETVDNSSEKSNLIPLYDDVATYGSNIGEMEMAPVQNPTEYIDAGTWFGNTKITAAIRHYGESMAEYPNGCILALKEIHDFDNVVYGRNYIIETDEIRVTKRIQSGQDETQIMAYSTNTETYPDGKQIHEPFPIKKAKIKRVMLVIGRIVKEHGSGPILTI